MSRWITVRLCSQRIVVNCSVIKNLKHLSAAWRCITRSLRKRKFQNYWWTCTNATISRKTSIWYVIITLIIHFLNNFSISRGKPKGLETTSLITLLVTWLVSRRRLQTLTTSILPLNVQLPPILSWSFIRAGLFTRCLQHGSFSLLFFPMICSRIFMWWFP